jgi:hypothetical protein
VDKHEHVYVGKTNLNMLNDSHIPTQTHTRDTHGHESTRGYGHRVHKGASDCSMRKHVGKA